MAIENNQNQNQNLPLNPGENSRYAHLSPPLPGDQTNMIFLLNEEMNRRSREADMASIGLPLQFSPPLPLPGDQTNILLNPSFCSNLYELIQRYMVIGLTPGESSRSAHLSPPLTGDQTNILQNPAYCRPNEEMNRRSVREEIHVREELGQMSHYNFPPPRLLQYPNMQPQYGLRFINKVKDPTYTTKPVRDKNGDPISVEIYNSNNGSRVSPNCFLSSAKVRIIVLDAAFRTNRVNWSSEFVQNELTEREGKGPILIRHNLNIHLEKGVGIFENIFFNDNSSWTKSGFRLGVMVEIDGEEGQHYLNGIVQEGVSEPFQVRDRRTEASEKPKQLKLTHNVKCIKKIGKDRASLLQKENINTVYDFLKSYYNDEAALRKILGIKSESDRGWLSMVDHVRQNTDLRPKYNASNNISQPRQYANGDSVQRTNVGGSAQIDPRSYFDPDVNAPLAGLEGLSL